MTVRNLLGKAYSTYGGYGFVTLPGKDAFGDTNAGYSYYYYPSDPRALMVTAKYRF